MNEPLCTIIIPVLNQLAYTQQCLEGIWRNTADVSFEVIVVDNGSTDGTAQYLEQFKANHHELTVISFPENRGFSEANNSAAQVARGKFLMLLNNDTLPLPGWLSNLIAAVEVSGAQIGGAKLIAPRDNSIDHAGYVYGSALKSFYPIYHRFYAESPAVNRQREYQAVLGACLLIRRDLYHEVGGLWLHGLEDIDLCLKVRRAGGGVLYVPSSRVYHHRSVTLNDPSVISPPVTSEAFSKAWPRSERLVDDIDYYDQDGFEMIAREDGSIALRHRDNLSYELCDKALALKNNKDFSAAIRLLAEATQADPFNKGALLLTIELLAAKGEALKAYQTLKALVGLDPLHLEAYLIGAEFCLNNGRIEEGQEWLNSLLTLSDLDFTVRTEAKNLADKFRLVDPTSSNR
ncbi:MAG: glycosyltransferase [Bdellovibrionales bacterium]|nr:glycosyltransferase [Bdellovibrionales bacterium]